MGKLPDHYSVLGVPRTALAPEIRRAYLGLLRRLHPDTRRKTYDGGTSEAADLQQLHAIMQAYVVLSDPGKRAAYDRELSLNRPAGTPVEVRVHRKPAPPGPVSPGAVWPGPASPGPAAPLRFGPSRWSPPPGTTSQRRRT